MTELCIRIYRYFRRHYALYWFSLAGLFLFCGYFAAQIHLEEDLNKLMPSSRNEDSSTKLAFANLRIKDKTFLLFEGVDGASTERIIEVCDAFIDSLQVRDAAQGEGHGSVGDVFYRLSDDLLPDAIDYLSGHLPAYIDTSLYARIDTMLTQEHFTRQMERNRIDLTGDFGSMYPELIQADPIGLRNLLAEQMKPLAKGGTGGYHTIDGHFFVPDSTVCVAFLTPRYSATNTGQGSSLFRLLNGLTDEFSETAPDVRICYHGTPASGFYNASQIKHDLTGTIGGSLLLVLLFLCVCFRNRDTLPLLLLPVLFGTLFGLAMMYFLKGEFSLLALGIGAVVLGVAMSYVLHVLTHYKYVGNPEQVLREQVKPVCLGCLTTIGSFMGLFFIDTALLQDFGLFAAFAITGTTAFSLTYLPGLLRPEKNRMNHRAFTAIDRINAYPFHRKKGLLAGIAVVTFVCIGCYVACGTQFDADMHNLGYKAERTTYSENLLLRKTYTADKQKYFAASGQTMEEAIERFALLSHKLDSMQRIGLVKNYTHTDKLFIPLRVQQERMEAWKRYWTDERLEQVRRLIAATAPEAGLRPEAFEPFFDYATADYEPDALYKAGIIPPGYWSTLMEQSYNDEHLCFTSVRCANDTVRSHMSDYYRICDAIVTEPNLMVLDTYYYTTDTLTAMNEDFNVLQWVSMLFVFVVLLVSFRFNLKHTLLAFLPILLSWLIVLGAMTIFGMRFNLINIIISTFIFGIGVDYSIFVMNGLIGGEKDSRLLAYHKTAIFFSAVTLIVTVGSMLFAEHPAIRSVGFSTLVGLVSAVGLSYVVQPAVYGWINKKGGKA
ncbi:MMPL family transporter [Parabacteroides distasonis]|uniref:MMPL family transporter n=1 Tax=Parabacteroides distasonis TaxID=823 RepID=UPI0018A04D1D|nr:MMPL family transporter [Parabacteroides distasonis]MDB9152913.1 MMPL family transporter [Parabacteroides distasonis]MDB9157490.1 MMPL family transporter [Parabacteroides distasonis]MDB9163973.1 MMPL family transporter [Parabacteroides distasonis]MDB9167785.1 MMPL family transporter [Parabacteroides distasonis]MDB9194501.1 MMPL family transporter [Parabacteroides distasonis]